MNFSVLFINHAPPSQALCCLDDASSHVLYLTLHGSLLGTSFLNPMIRVNLFCLYPVAFFTYLFMTSFSMSHSEEQIAHVSHLCELCHVSECGACSISSRLTRFNEPSMLEHR